MLLLLLGLVTIGLTPVATPAEGAGGGDLVDSENGESEESIMVLSSEIVDKVGALPFVAFVLKFEMTELDVDDDDFDRVAGFLERIVDVKSTAGSSSSKLPSLQTLPPPLPPVSLDMM